MEMTVSALLSCFAGLAGEASVCLRAAQRNIIVKDAKRITSMFFCHCFSPSTCLPAVFCVVTFPVLPLQPCFCRV